MTSPLISPVQLLALMGAPDLRLIDASWHLDGRDGRPDFDAARIPGAVFFDLEASSDQVSNLPHMLPSREIFAARMRELGVAETDRIVVYDTVGVRSAPRVWWMLKVMGAGRVQVLDGGLPAWRAAGGPIESRPPADPKPAVFHARLDEDAVLDLPGVRSALAEGVQVLDARAAPRFRGEAAEPRAGLRSGHMPGALNLPFPEVLTPDGGLKDRDGLRAVFAQAGIDLDRPVVTTCGSGVTAAILSLALAELGHDSRLYDGSWAEWGGPNGGEVVTGA